MMNELRAAREHPALAALLRQLAGRPEVRRVILFGSRARGDAEPRADIDLAVEAPDATRREWLEIVELADDARTLLTIDLARLDEASEPFRDRILAEGEVLYERTQDAAGPR